MTTAGAVRYTVRRGTQGSGAYRIQKWRERQKVGTVWVEPDGWWQRCSCPAWQYRQGACKHIRLINLLHTGRLEAARSYVWEQAQWKAAEGGPSSAANTQGSVAAVQPLGGLNNGSIPA